MFDCWSIPLKIFIFLLLSIFVLVSCAKDEGASGGVPAELVSWEHEAEATNFVKSLAIAYEQPEVNGVVVSGITVYFYDAEVD